MPQKYHVSVKTAPPRCEPIGKYGTIEFREDCAGSCRNCVKNACVYGIFKENYQHMSTMDEPEYLYTCQSCFRCVQECTRGIFSRIIDPEYRTLGDDYWRSDIIHRLWYQAHTGKIPVSGAGYRGPFVGKGFDAMWTDMSEIVRPTRDGIHGREYINTCIEISRRKTPLVFDEELELAVDVPPILEVPIPLLFQLPDDLILNEQVLVAAAGAAQVLDTLLIVRPEDYSEALRPYTGNLVPRLAGDNYKDYESIIRQSRAVELDYGPDVEKAFNGIRALMPEIIIIVRLPLDRRAATLALELARFDVDTIHLFADEYGNELNTKNPRFMKEMIREVHLELVGASVRQKVNLVFSGGIAMAEHMAKAIICGADGVVVDRPLLIALECRLCYRCKKGLSCPVNIEGDIDPDWGSQRMINLMGAWHSQLIEVMGAMGIREARRLRGEVGRSMWFEDLEMENFAPIFGTRKVKGLG